MSWQLEVKSILNKFSWKAIISIPGVKTSLEARHETRLSEAAQAWREVHGLRGLPSRKDAAKQPFTGSQNNRFGTAPWRRFE